MTTANNPYNNLSPWKPGQSGNPSGNRDVAGYVIETTDRGKKLVDALGVHRQGRHTHCTGAVRLQVKEGPAGAASRPVGGHRDAFGPCLRQVTTTTGHSPQCLRQATGPFIGCDVAVVGRERQAA